MFNVITLTIVGIAAFLLGVTVAKFGPISRFIGPNGRVDPRQFRRGALTVFGFAIAFYLMMIAIITTQVFDQQLSNTGAPGTRLTKFLSEISVEVPESLTNTARPIKQNFEGINSWLDDLRKVNPQTAAVVDGTISNLTEYSGILESVPKSFIPKQKEKITSIQELFEEQNQHLLGSAYVELYIDDLSQLYRTWISTYVDTAKKCRSAIISEQSEFSIYVLDVKTAFQADPQGKGAFPNWNNQLASTTATECDFDAAISDLKPLPSHTVTQSFGVVYGPLAGWLLTTESRELALITGLVGFGIFGALSASFIRPNGPKPTKREPGSAFIRGISAAVLIYLVAVGGLAVFTRGSAPPNPYAVYFACFVASVFSEDVWNWARQRQQRSLAEAESTATKPRPPAPPRRAAQDEQGL